MQRITMFETGAVKHRAIVVEHRRPVNDFITAIAVDIGDREAVRPFPIETFPFSFGTVEPSKSQPTWPLSA